MQLFKVHQGKNLILGAANNYTHCTIEFDGREVDVPDSLEWFLDPRIQMFAESLGMEYNTRDDLIAFVERFKEFFTDDYFLRDSLSIASISDGDTNPHVVGDIKGDPPLFKEKLIERQGTRFTLIPPLDDVSNDYSFIGSTFDSRSKSYYRCWEQTATPHQLPHEYSRVMNYSYRPHELTFMPEGKERTELFFGMELEVSTRLNVIELQTIVTQVEPKQELFFFVKSDSSISGKYDWQYEIVTHPMTPRRARKEWKILMAKISRLAEDKGETVGDYFDTSDHLTNGLHIHVSTRAFARYGLSEGHKNRFLTAFNQWDEGFQKYLQRISKRSTLPRDNRFCRINPALDGLTLARRLARGQKQGEEYISSEYLRYSSCHATSQTVEVRVFQGIFDINHILNCIEFTEAMFYYTLEAPIRSYGPSFVPKFQAWVRRQHGYRNLKEII